MAKQLQRETLPAKVRQEMVRILSIDSMQHTPLEKAFLYARRDYLSAAEIKMYDVRQVTAEERGSIAPVEEKVGNIYHGVTVPVLKADLKERGLAVGGSRAKLVARLEEDDNASDEDEA